MAQNVMFISNANLSYFTFVERYICDDDDLFVDARDGLVACLNAEKSVLVRPPKSKTNICVALPAPLGLAYRADPTFLFPELVQHHIFDFWNLLQRPRWD